MMQRGSVSRAPARAKLATLRRAEQLERHDGLGIPDAFAGVAGGDHSHAHVILLAG